MHKTKRKLPIKIFCYFTLSILIIFHSNAQEAEKKKYEEIERKVSKIVEFDVAVLSQKVTLNLENDKEKVWAIYCWIAKNIKYDINKYNTGAGYPNSHKYSRDDVDWKSYIDSGESRSKDYRQKWTLDSNVTYSNISEQVVRDGKGICMGYSALFRTMCVKNKIKCFFVDGFSKPIGCDHSKPDHAWNVVEIDKVFYLIDVTWGAGYVDNLYHPKLFEKSFTSKYFMTAPNEFIKNHLSRDPKWTLLTNPPSLREFCSQP